MTWRPPRASLKVRQTCWGKWVVVREQRHQSGRIVSGEFATRAEAVASRESMLKGERA